MIKDRKTLGIYIHIPFCMAKCEYCDFLSFADFKQQDKYIDYLIKEIINSSIDSSLYLVETVFIGGGTPSSIDSAYIVRIMEALKKRFALSETAEITIECNPGTVDKDKLCDYKAVGINRISFGLQSADNDELKMLGRIHTYEEFLKSYNTALECGFDNINIDVMSGLMYQSVDKYEQTLKKVCELAPSHISAYSLIVEEETPLAKKLDILEGKGICPLPDENTERKMYHVTKDILSKYGYRRYEISNYAKEGFECRHNMSYWERVDYRGFGLGAASLIDESRYTNVRDFDSYYDMLDKGEEPFCESEILTKKDAMSEFMFLGLRKCDGIKKSEFFQKFGVEYDEVYSSVSEKYKKLNMLTDTKDTVCLTDEGMDVSNVIMADYLPD